MSDDSPAGVVYTRPWVASMILDLARLDPSTDLIDRGPIVEPACGDGAFITAIVDRVVRSARQFGHTDDAMRDAIVAYDIDHSAVTAAKDNAVHALRNHGYTPKAARRLADHWIRLADFLTSTADTPRAGWVVGNPPYIRIEKADPELMRTYRSRWSTMTGRADLYIGFIEAGLSILSDGGRLAYICPDRWMFNAYGRATRAFIMDGYDLESVVTMHDVDAFAQRVNAYPATIVIRRGAHSRPFVAEARAGLDQDSAADLLAAARAGTRGLSRTVEASTFRYRRPSDWPPAANGWTFPLDADHDLVSRLQQRLPTLEDAGVTVKVGVATGADGVFIVREEHGIEPDRLEPVISAAETATGSIVWLQRHIVNPWDEHGLIALADAPGLAAYLGAHETRLRERRVARDHPDRWYRTIDRIHPELTALPKLLIPDVKDLIDPVLDPGSYQPMHNLYYLLAPDWDLQVLGGLMLSETVAAFVRSYSVRMANGYMRVSAQYLRRIRVPARSSIGPDVADDLRRAFVDRDREAASRAALKAYGL